MKCEDVLELISGRIDGENTPEEEMLLQAHLETCEHCREILCAYEEMDRGVAALGEMPSADFTEKVMAAVKQETAAKKKQFTMLPLLATAAAVVLVIGLGAVRPVFVQETAAPMAARTMAEESLICDQAAAGETVAMERQAHVVVTEEMLPELENCPSEVLANGSLLYELPDVDAAEKLSDAYGLELYRTETARQSYALLIP